MDRFLKNSEEFIKFFKFTIIGFINTFFQLGIYYLLLYIGVNYNLSFAIGFIFSVLNAYVLNNKFVFKTDNVNTKNKLIKIYSSYGTTFLLSQILLYLGIEELGISQKIMPIINIIFMTPLNFLLNRFFVFSGERL